MFGRDMSVSDLQLNLAALTDQIRRGVDLVFLAQGNLKSGITQKLLEINQ